MFSKQNFTLRRLLRSLQALVLILAVLAPAAPGAAPRALADVSPKLEVSLSHDTIFARNWPAGVLVTLTIDDPENGAGIDYTFQGVSGPSYSDPSHTVASFYLGGMHRLLPGMLVSATGGLDTVSVTVASVDVETVDPASDMVSGTADPGTEVTVDVYEGGETTWRMAVAGEDGAWSVDFSTPVTEYDLPAFDILETTTGIAAIPTPGWQAYTSYIWPEHQTIGQTQRIIVRPENNWVRGRDWPLDEPVTLTVDDVDTVGSPDYTDEGWAEFLDDGPSYVTFRIPFDVLSLQPNDVVTLSGSGFTRQLVIAPGTVDAVDFSTRSLRGTAASGVGVYVYAICGKPEAWRFVYADEAGNWLADFSQPGEYLNEAAVLDSFYGCTFQAEVWDIDFDRTRWQRWTDIPFIEGHLDYEWVMGWNWAEGGLVTLNVYESSTDEDPIFTGSDIASLDPAGSGRMRVFYPLDFDLQPGMIVTLSDSMITKQLDLIDARFSEARYSDDRVWGQVDPFTSVQLLYINHEEGWETLRRAVSDDAGYWEVDFSQPGEQDDEQLLVDLQPGMELEYYQYDAENDATLQMGYVNYPYFFFWVTSDLIRGTGFDTGNTVSYEIDLPSTGPGVDFSISQVSRPRPNNPRAIRADAYLGDQARLEPGTIVTASDGFEAVTGEVLDEGVTSIDFDLDSMVGWGPPGRPLYLEAGEGDPYFYAWRDFGASSDGLWTADFSQPGPNPCEDIFDLTPAGEGVLVASTDDNPAETYWLWPDHGMVGQAQRIDANLARDSVRGIGWPLGATVDFSVFDPETSSIVYQDTQVSIDNPSKPGQKIVVFDLSGVLELSPGLVLSMSGEGRDRQLTIHDLQVALIDQADDRLEGSAPAEGGVMVTANCPDGEAHRFVRGGLDGSWSADFTAPGAWLDEYATLDLNAGCEYQVEMWDVDFDGTRWGLSDIPAKIVSIGAPLEPHRIGSLVPFTAELTGEMGEPHTALWEWGDGASSLGAVSGTGVAGSHAYSAPGLYTVRLTVQEGDQPAVLDSYGYVVVYDPSGGFVTGGGWLEAASPAHLAFNCKYRKDGSTPEGKLTFQLPESGQELASTGYSWLIINPAGTQATFKGYGLLDGQPAENGSPYYFLVWATDGQPDQLRLRIYWVADDGVHVLYDSPSLPLGGGNIVVHAK